MFQLDEWRGRRNGGKNGGKKRFSSRARLWVAIHLSVAALAAGTPTGVLAGPEDVAPGPYFRVKGLPAGAMLSGGQTNAEHTWSVPLWALDDLKDDLKIEIPSGLSGNLDLVVALVGSNGTVLAERTVALRVKSTVAATPSADAADAAQRKQAASTASNAARGATRDVGPGDRPEHAPLGPSVRIKGLPDGVTLSGAVPLAIGERAWMVPLGVLDDLKIEIPSGLSGNLDLLFDLIDDDGVVLAERTVEVRVTPAVTPPPLPLSGEALETAVARSAPGAASGKEVAAAGGPEPEAVQHNDAAIARSASPPGGAASGEAVAAAPGGPEPKAAQRKYATVASGAPSAIGPTATLVKRGQDFIANGDLAAARLVLRRAVDRGDAQAALLLGSTYDPASFKRLKVIGLAPDPGQARAWYQRAVDLGSAEAVRRLEPLAQGAR